MATKMGTKMETMPATKKTKKVLEGPPWCGHVDPEEAYFRGQAGSMGSGLLGGWGYATAGGAFVGPGPREQEVKDALAEISAAPPPPPPAETPGRTRPPAGRRHREARVQPLRPHTR